MDCDHDGEDTIFVVAGRVRMLLLGVPHTPVEVAKRSRQGSSGESEVPPRGIDRWLEAGAAGGAGEAGELTATFVPRWS